MGKKNKKEKDELEIKDTKKDPNQEEDNDKVSIKKTFRDTGIIMALLAVIVGIVVYVNREALDPNYVGPEQQEDEQSGTEKEIDAALAYKNLCSLANRQLKEKKNINNDVDYISGLASLEFGNNLVTYCAKGDKQDEYSYMVKVTMNYAFTNGESEFMFKMTNLNANTAAITYSVSCEVMSIYNEERINNRFDDLLGVTLPLYDTEKVYTHTAYRADGSETTHFSVTYAGTDSMIHSINEMTYNESLDQFTVSNEYKIAPTTDGNLYALLGIILDSD